MSLKSFYAIPFLSFLLSCNNRNDTPMVNDKNNKWWKEAVVYQIYPRSFQDSDGDGVGDLKGIIQRLDYVKSLGIDVVWLNPIYTSPNDDNGYDISDYRNIMKEMGTMEDFDALLKGMHQRGIKLVMDLVVNHSSDEHRWFKESKSSRTNPYRDYYHWWPAEKGMPPKRWSFFDEEENAWRYDSVTNAFYLHYFSRKQPDLKWENPKLRREIYDLMSFWFDKGVDGFRMDVIPFISKDTSFPELPKEYNGNYPNFYAKGPDLHSYLQEMNKEVLSKYNVMTVGEGAGVVIGDALKLVDEDRKELDMFFQFEAADWGKKKGDFMYPDDNNRHLTDLKNIFSKWDSVFANKGWGTVYFGNHDQSRMVSRYGNDKPEYRESSAKMLYTLLLTQRATPYVYYGDEIGMTNINFTDISQYKDLATINYYNRLQRSGGDVKRFLEGQARVSRDNGRTPMQWDATEKAGFTNGMPWLRINTNKTTINVTDAEKNKNSILYYFRAMIKLRKEKKEVLVYGKYTLLDKENPDVYAYTRETGSEKVLVLLSFSQDGGTFNLDKMQLGDVWINNVQGIMVAGGKVQLQPYQACIVKLKNQ